jgi:toxin ParE1/3/4
MTGFALVYDVQARSDLKGQFDFILEQSGAGRAVDFVERIETFVEKLGTFPEMGRVLTTNPVCVRAITFRREIHVVYAFDGHRVLVLRLFRKGQDFDGWLKDILEDEPPT